MPLEPSTRLGPYEIVVLLGAGGMGEVYRARDTRLGRDIAIKVMSRAITTESDRHIRFEQEARAASSLNHPNIVAVYDVGSENGVFYVVSELLEGETLRDRLREGPLPARKALDYAVQVARGLAAAHDKGLVHRDLKPENVFVLKDGRVKILDFGLAKSVLPKEAPTSPYGPEFPTLTLATQPGIVMGTVGYTAPEQIRGKPADFRSDIFSFGVILYEMLGGRHPFRGDSAVEVMNAIIKDDPPDLPPATPPALERIVVHCLEKDPEARFDSARDLAFALESLGAVSGAGAIVSARWRAFAATRRWKFGVTLAAGLLAGAVLSRVLLPPSLPPAPVFRFLTYSGHDSSPAVSPDGKTVAFTSDRDGRSRIWVKELADGGEAAITAGWDDFPRFAPNGSAILFTRREEDQTALYRQSIVGGEPRKVVDDVTNGDWSPDGSQIAFVRLKMTASGTTSIIGVVGIDGSRMREIAVIPNQFLRHPRWSPDGSRIVAVGSPNLGINQAAFVVEAAGGQPPLVVTPVPGPDYISAAAWNRSGELVYFQAESGLDGSGAASGAARIVRRPPRRAVGSVVSHSQRNAQVIDLFGLDRIVFDTNSARENLQEHRMRAEPSPTPGRWLTQGSSNDRQPIYTPGGEWIIFSSNRSGNLDLWKISPTSGEIRRITDDKADDTDPGITADGKTVLWASNRGGHFEIYAGSLDGSGTRQVTQDGHDAENPTATPDGEWIVYCSYHPAKTGVWKIRRDGRDAKQLVKGNVMYPEVSPDGQYALYATSNGRSPYMVRVVRIADGAAVPFEIRADVRNGGTAASVGRSRWMPDGRAIAFIGQDEKGVNGIYVQDFTPGKDSSRTRRPLAGFDTQLATESFGISRNGAGITIASWEQVFSIMLAEGVPLK